MYAMGYNEFCHWVAYFGRRSSRRQKYEYYFAQLCALVKSAVSGKATAPKEFLLGEEGNVVRLDRCDHGAVFGALQVALADVALTQEQIDTLPESAKDKTGWRRKNG